MSNPAPAYRGTHCDGCGHEVEEGEDIFFEDGQKYCESCARDGDNICDCGQYKKEEYKTCYDCK